MTGEGVGEVERGVVEGGGVEGKVDKDGKQEENGGTTAFLALAYTLFTILLFYVR